MGKVIKSDFFKSGSEQTGIRMPKKSVGQGSGAAAARGKSAAMTTEKSAAGAAGKPTVQTAEKPSAKPIMKKITPMCISPSVMNALRQTSTVLKACKCPKAAHEIDKIFLRGTRNAFSVAVVGEFSRGKSTLINGILEREILPVGDLPTTAMLTHIKYNTKDTMVHIDLAGNMVTLPPNQDSWEGLVADNFGHCDPQGAVHIGLKSRWLGENNVELIDTPGAGDLEEQRAKLIGDALLNCDGAIITVSAASPLSLTEKTFVEERVIACKTPFLLLAITKLDTIPQKERSKVIEYIKNKLQSWKINIPVFVPAQVDMKTDKYESIMGYDKIKTQILKWINDRSRVKLTEEWISAQAVSVLERELNAMRGRKELMDIDDEHKRGELIATKKAAVDHAVKSWEPVLSEMRKRSELCTQKVMEKIDESTKTMIERLQYEVSHTGNAEKWWKEDYPYRLKIELTNLSVGATGVMTRIVSDDVRWLNTSYEQNFKSRAAISAESTNADRAHDRESENVSDIRMNDIEKQRKAVRIGSTVLSIVGASSAMALGHSSLIWTMGVGTAISMVSETIFKKELDFQRNELKKKLEQDVPLAVEEAAAKTRDKIDYIYEDIIKNANLKKDEWCESQKTAIDQCAAPFTSEDKAALIRYMEALERLLVKLT